MHIDPRYSSTLPAPQTQTSAGGYQHRPEHWYEKDEAERELNEGGVYIHRFAKQGGAASNFNMAHAVSKLLEHTTPTPCTYVGPTFCRTYNHYVWDGCAGLVFGADMHQVLAYKSDIYSDRLSSNPARMKSFLSDHQGDFSKAAQAYATHIMTAYNQLGPTTSAFKMRRTKQLRLATVVDHHQAKCREMNERINAYFRPASDPSHALDVETKKLIVQRLNLSDTAIAQMTRQRLITDLNALGQQDPVMLPFIRTAVFKINAMPNDASLRTYLARHAESSNKSAAQRSYVAFLKAQYETPKAHANADPTTIIPPNEVLGLPRPVDLLGFVLDSSSLVSFQQAQQTYSYFAGRLDKQALMTLNCFLYLPSHMLGQSLIQLGWSRHVLPWLPDNLLKQARGEPMQTMDSPPKQEYANLYRLLARIAENSVLQIQPGYQAIGKRLQVKCNLPLDLANLTGSTGSNGQGDTVSILYLAAASKLPFEQFLLYWYCNACSPQAHANEQAILDALAQGKLTSNRKTEWLTNHHALSQQAKRAAFMPILSAQLHKLFTTAKQSNLAKYGATSERRFRSGHLDQGEFAFDPALGSIHLRCGQRWHADGSFSHGFFAASGDLLDAGASLAFGLHMQSQQQPLAWQLGASATSPGVNIAIHSGASQPSQRGKSRATRNCRSLVFTLSRYQLAITVDLADPQQASLCFQDLNSGQSWQLTGIHRHAPLDPVMELSNPAYLASQASGRVSSQATAIPGVPANNTTNSAASSPGSSPSSSNLTSNLSSNASPSSLTRSPGSSPSSLFSTPPMSMVSRVFSTASRSSHSKPTPGQASSSAGKQRAPDIRQLLATSLCGLDATCLLDRGRSLAQAMAQQGSSRAATLASLQLLSWQLSQDRAHLQQLLRDYPSFQDGQLYALLNDPLNELADHWLQAAAFLFNPRHASATALAKDSYRLLASYLGRDPQTGITMQKLADYFSQHPSAGHKFQTWWQMAHTTNLTNSLSSPTISPGSSGVSSVLGVSRSTLPSTTNPATSTAAPRHSAPPRPTGQQARVSTAAASNQPAAPAAHQPTCCVVM